MIRIRDYEKEDGLVDWPAYEEAQKDTGEICLKCGDIILFGKGYPETCVSCKKLAKDEEVDHDCFIRCPHCRNTFNPHDDGGDSFDLFSEGEHEVWCCKCDKTFEVSTHISWSFTSPPMEKTDGDS